MMLKLLIIASFCCYLVNSAFVYPGPNSLDNHKYWAQLDPARATPPSVRDAEGWTCKALVPNGANIAIQATNNYAGRPGIYFYYDNGAVGGGPGANTVLYIGKSDYKVSTRLLSHKTNDFFCSTSATAAWAQYACGYCWMLTRAPPTAGDNDYDTYIYEALLLYLICAPTNSEDNGGTWTGQTCLMDPNTGAEIEIRLTFRDYIIDLPTGINTLTAGNLFGHLGKHKAMLDCPDGKCNKKEKIVHPTHTGFPTNTTAFYDPGYQSFKQLKVFGIIEALQKVALTPIYTVGKGNPSCAGDDEDRIEIAMSNKLQIYFVDPNTSQGPKGSRLECYGFITDNIFTVDVTLCTAYLFEDASGSTEEIVAMTSELLYGFNGGNENQNMDIKLSDELLEILQSYINEKWSNSPTRAQLEYQAFENVVVGFGRAITELTTFQGVSATPPAPVCNPKGPPPHLKGTPSHTYEEYGEDASSRYGFGSTNHGPAFFGAKVLG